MWWSNIKHFWTKRFDNYRFKLRPKTIDFCYFIYYRLLFYLLPIHKSSRETYFEIPRSIFADNNNIVETDISWLIKIKKME